MGHTYANLHFVPACLCLRVPSTHIQWCVQTGAKYTHLRRKVKHVQHRLKHNNKITTTFTLEQVRRVWIIDGCVWLADELGCGWRYDLLPLLVSRDSRRPPVRPPGIYTHIWSDRHFAPCAMDVLRWFSRIYGQVAGALFLCVCACVRESCVRLRLCTKIVAEWKTISIR